jgi:hypothetical protein
LVLEKKFCEICGESNKKILHNHHIVERTELNCDNSDFNLACICPSCHAKVHAKLIKLIGIFPSTKNNGRLLVYIDERGICNVPGMEEAEPYYSPKPIFMKIYDKETDEKS